jgi:hypothetical protein
MISNDYATSRCRPSMRLRIITESASCALCGAPHNAEFERELIVERTKAGLASARARGRNGGRHQVGSSETGATYDS